MPMNGNTWGTAVKNAIAALGITAGTEVTPTQLEQFWQAVKVQDVTHITGNSVVTGNVTSGAGSGGSVLGQVTG